MKKLLLIFPLLLIGCKNESEIITLKEKISKLNRKNDSLKELIQNKFIFDNAALRIIPSIKNSKKVDSKFNGEVVIVGYNKNDIAILGKRWNYIDRSFTNSDTIRNKEGAYNLNLDQIKNDTVHVYVKIDKKYGSRGYDTIVSFPYQSFWELK